MTQFVCKCLNIIIKCETSQAETVDLEKLGFTCAEQRDSFFREKWSFYTKADITLAQEPLVEEQQIKGLDGWILYSCLSCKVQTHALFRKAHDYKYLIKNSCMISQQALAAMLKSDNYSPVFKILIEEKQALAIALKLPSSTSEKMQPAVGSLSRQLTKSLQSQLELVEEEIRAYRDKKYAEFECFREKAHNDHKILSSLIGSRNESKEEAPSWFPMEVTTPLSPQTVAMVSLPPQPRGRISSFKGQVKPKQSKRPIAQAVGPKEDSLDSEGIFDLEGMDSETPSHNGASSDMYFSDSDDSVSRDEGIHIARGSGAHKINTQSRASNIAKSLPMNMPRFNNSHDIPLDDLDDEDEPADIAASIKALARSVHGDVFGDLPRPRFSTLI